MPGPNTMLRRFRAVVQVAPRAFAVVRSKRTPPIVSALSSFEGSDALVQSSGLPTTTAISTSPSMDQPLDIIKSTQRRWKYMRSARETTKDVLLLSLDALSESSDAFPPLKSVVGGLRFFVTQAELVSDNKAQIRKIYVQIDAFTASLVRAIPDVTALAPAHEAAIRALAQ